MPAFADVADLNSKPLNIPTLDYLKQSNPDFPNSVYTLTEIDEQSENTITKYELDYANSTYIPVYYKIELKQPEYGIGSEIYKTTLTNIPLKDVEITFKYNTEDIKNRIENAEDNVSIDKNSVFIGNSGNLYGGAINNFGTISDITADFAGNNADYYGGAIYNPGTIGDITANFVGNTTNYYGGAINNNGTIGDITANFANNNAGFAGGSIYNDGGKIGNITADFLSNNAGSNGAAIYNSNGTILNISGDFIGNSVKNSGGAIYNNSNSTIGDVTGDFIGNSTILYHGGAIYNFGKMGNITGDFIENSAAAGHAGDGGAIFNYYNAIVGNIKGNFIGNSSSRFGGAIYNYGTTEDIEGLFIGNSAEASGGAIENYYNCIIGDITGNFIGNSAELDLGGAIENNGTIGNITGNFIKNSAGYDGGAISNDGEILKIKGDFIENNSKHSAGALFNEGTIDSISGNFIGNYSSGTSKSSNGGAIYNNIYGTIGNITGDFIDNRSANYGGAISNRGIMTNLQGVFRNNATETSGGAIYNSGTINDINGDFLSNSAKTTGGAIDNYSKIGNVKSSFTGNTAGTSGGAIYNSSGSIGDVTGVFIGNSAKNSGGAIYNDTATFGDIVGDFLANYVENESGTAQGGAVWTNSDLSFVADNRTTTFQNNYTKSSGVKDDNAIYVADAGATVNFKLKNGGQFVMKDNIRGKSMTEPDENSNTSGSIIDSYKINIQGDSITKTTFHMLNDMYDANLSFGNTTINTLNNNIHVYDVNKLTVTSDTNMVADVDLLNQTMDRYTANDYGKHSGNLNVVGVNLLTDAPKERDLTAIYFAQPGLKNNVVNGLGELPDTYQTTVYTPIYKYNVIYDKEHEYNGQGDGGYFVFLNGDKYVEPDTPDTPDNSDIQDTPVIPSIPNIGSTGNPSDAFNPAVLNTSVANIEAQAAMTDVFEYVFEHADAFTQFPLMERLVKLEANKYAMASTDFNQNLGSFNYEQSDKAFWIRPYTIFERMDLKNGPDVDAVRYGTLIGYDGDLKQGKKGWYRMGTTYVGYQGATLDYSGVDTTMNGGTLGVTETLYKKNFWTALTLAAGANVGDTHNMYGKEDFTTFVTGVASKTGYNFEFKDGKYILQPIWQMSYTFAKTFDYKNSSGVTIKSNPAHSIHLSPRARFIVNCKNGWQPYAQVGMVWNVMNQNKTTANGIRLPEMSIKPYVEYGLGLQHQWKDKYTAFGQAMVRNGGRSGIELTAGFRWALGKEDKQTKNVPNHKKTTLVTRNGEYYTKTHAPNDTDKEG